MLADATGTLLNLLALLFGVGVGLAFDEFALWLHLDDVYWSRQGRKSIDAVAWALIVTAPVRAVGPVHGVPGHRGGRQHVVAPGPSPAPDGHSRRDLRPARKAGDRGARHRLPADRADRSSPAGQAGVVLGSALLPADLTPARSVGAPIRHRLRGPLGSFAGHGGRRTVR